MPQWRKFKEEDYDMFPRNRPILILLQEYDRNKNKLKPVIEAIEWQSYTDSFEIVRHLACANWGSYAPETVDILEWLDDGLQYES